MPKLTTTQRVRFYINRKLHALSSRLYFRTVGAQERPIYFDVAKTRPELRRLDDNWDVINEELQGVLKNRESVPRYHEIDPKQKDISAKEGNSWRTFVFYLWGCGDLLVNRRSCPKTVAILDTIPGVQQALFSILDPGCSIPGHNGPSLHYLRYHLAFIVPTDSPPTIRIRDTYYTWKKGESMLFDDSYHHEIYNDSKELRVILMVDFLRPKPWYVLALTRFVVWNYVSAMREEDWLEGIPNPKPAAEATAR